MFITQWFRTSLLTGLCLVTLAASDAWCSDPSDVNWNQWRGPRRDGSSVASDWPEKLDESRLTKRWSVSLQPSYSGPVVWHNMVFSTETVDKKYERVTAFDRDSGEKLWSQQWQGAMTVPFFAAKNGSWIRSTPACDGETLYVGGMLDVLVAIDIASGDVRWKVDFVERMKSALPAFGFVSSPLIDGESLYVQAGGGVVKLNKRTGEMLWHSLTDGGGMNGSAFSSPILGEIRGERQLLVQSRELLAGLSLDDGRVLWSHPVPAFRGMNILTPTLVDDRIFTSSYGGKSFLYDVTKDEQAWAVSTAWENKVQGYMSSPIVFEGHVYLHLRNRRFACLDLMTGKEKWITTPFGEYWSMIRQGDRILALDEQGELLLIHASPEKFDLIDRRKVSDDSAWAHLANDGEQLFIRNLSGLRCFRWVEPLEVSASGVRPSP